MCVCVCVCARARAWCLALMCSLLYYYGTISKHCYHSSLAVSELSKGQYNILSLQNDWMSSSSLKECYWIWVPIASTEVSYSLPTSLPPLHCRPPRRVQPVEDGHPCYVDAAWQGSYFLVTPTKPWALRMKHSYIQ